jgi:hypothetical protein
MLKKLKILSSNIPKEYNEGFIIDYKKNKIVNISKNFTIKIPFKLLKSDFFSFELLLDKNQLNLNFIIDIDYITSNINSFEYIKNKNYIFSILKCAFKNNEIDDKKIEQINRFFDIKTIISKHGNSILRDNMIKLDDLYFNIEKENIYTSNDDYSVYLKPKIHFLFGIMNNYSIPNNYKLCIIDDKYKLDKSNLIICSDNYHKITRKIIENSTCVGICKDFFMSNEYLEVYKYFHNNFRSTNAFNNYKTYVNSLPKTEDNIFNIEIIDNIVFIINNVEKRLLIKHPIIHCDNHILIISKKLTEIDMRYSYKLLQFKYSSSNVNIKKILDSQSYFDRNKCFLLSMFNDNSITLCDKYLFHSINNNYKVFENSIDKECPINRENIGTNTHIELQCGHSFIYDNIDMFFSKHQICPYCSTKISSISINFHFSKIIQYIFKDINISNRDIYLFYKKTNKFLDFLSNYCTFAINIEDEIINIELEPDSIIILDINISNYDFTNLYITNLNIIHTLELIKLDFYY